LILGKIVKIVATRCRILRLNFTKFHFVPPPPAAGGHQGTYPDPWLDLRGPTSKHVTRKVRKGGKEGEDRGEKGRRKGGRREGRVAERKERR